MSNESEQDSVYKYSHLPLNERLKIYWQKNVYAVFWGTVCDEVIPGLRAYLMAKFGLTYEDSEDCISEALEGLATRQEEPQSVEHPRRYIWQSSIHSAIDLIKERTDAANVHQKLQCEIVINRGKRSNKGIFDEGDNIHIDQDFDTHPDQKPENRVVGNIEPIQSAVQPDAEIALTSENELSEGSPLADDVTYTEDMSESAISAESACYVIEGLLEGVAAEEPWTVRVIEKALTCLSPTERKVTETILMFGPDYISSAAQGDIGISAVAFRQYKYRAYEKLRVTIPQIMADMGIVFRRQPEADIFTQPPTEFPSEEEGPNNSTG